MDNEDKLKEEAKQQWGFVHGVLKNVVNNALTSIFYLTKISKGEAYLSSIKGINPHKEYDLLRATYASFYEAVDEWCKEKDIDPSDSRIFMLRKAFQVGITIVNADHSYRGLVYKFINKLFNMTPEKVKEFEKYEEPLPTGGKENFVFRKIKE